MGGDASKSEHLVEDMLTTLRAYRRAIGLCYMCGEKWGQDHKCAVAVQLHVVHELFDILGMTGSDTIDTQSETASECHIISRAAVQGSVAPETIRLQGLVQQQQVLMLVDSVSSHSFISADLAVRLQGVCVTSNVLKVKIADGGQLLCNQAIAKCKRSVQEHKFCTDLKVLPLGCYDMIIGMDWLEQNSPMDVHWGHKSISFAHHGKRITLNGIQPQNQECYSVSLDQLHFLLPVMERTN